jgi:hypothetical protein
MAIKALVAGTTRPSPRRLGATQYSNAAREKDRYMMQWFDYSCKSCGAVWAKHSVTISFRQTAVSNCARGVRSCASLQEHARMADGERFLTTKHMLGGSGTNLTPLPRDILLAEKRGLLLAVDPASFEYLYYKPHPTLAERKLPVRL